MDELTDEWMSGWWIGILMDGWTSRWMDDDRWIDEWMGSWMTICE